MKNTTTKPVRSDAERIDRLTTLTIQLSALITSVYVTRKPLSTEDGLMWLACDLADEIRILSEQVETMRGVAA
ncbi:hypothetical protein ACVBEH_17120 [Roseateles sp. GG27B]